MDAVPTAGGPRVPLHIAAVGATTDSHLMCEMYETCVLWAATERLGYETLGAILLRQKVFQSTGDAFSFSKSAFTHYDENQVEPLWGEADLDIPVEVCGIHWYGNHDYSRIKEPLTAPDSSAFIARLARGEVATYVC